MGEDQPGNPRTPEGSFEEESSAQRGLIVDSQSVKTTGVGGEERGYDGGKKVKGRKRHILVDTEGFVLNMKVHSAKIMDYEGIKTLLERAGEKFPRLSHLWLDGGYRGEDKGKDWVQKYLDWSVELVERPRKAAPKEVLMAWAAQWAKEGVTIDWRKLMAPGGFQVLPRRWVVERSFAWICHNRRMSLGTTRGSYVQAVKRSRICCHDSPHDEAVDPPVRAFHTVSEGEFSEVERLRRVGTLSW